MTLHGFMFSRFRFALVCILALAGFGLSPSLSPGVTGVAAGTQATAPLEDFDLLVRGGRVFDGSGNPWFYADIGVVEGRVAAVGDLSGASAVSVVDATGLVVAPGFIDVHTHADDDLYSMPYAENFIRDGVTSIVTGNCGGSVRDIGKYFEDLATTGTALNVATLVGHNTILKTVKGDTGAALTPGQMEKAKGLVREAMLDGAVGMSTGLIYTPGKYSGVEEIVELQKEAAAFGGVYATHMRSEGSEILAAIDEALRVGREAGCRVQISHFKVGAGTLEGGSRTTLAKVEAARAAGQEVWLDQYPYTASSTGMSVLFPDWLMEKGNDEARKTLQDPEGVKRILADLKAYHEGQRKRTDFEWAVIASSRAYPSLAGKSLQEAAERLAWRAEHGEASGWAEVDRARLTKVSLDDVYRAIIDIQLKGGASCVYHGMVDDDVERIMRSPLAAVCSDSGVRRFGSGNPHPRGYGSNARVLARYVREKGVLTIEEAIRKMTSLPALEFRMADRGLIRPGYWADLVVFNPDTVQDRSTFEKPHQYSTGFEYVIVNGEPVIEKGALTGKLPGLPIFGPGRGEENMKDEL